MKHIAYFIIAVYFLLLLCLVLGSIKGYTYQKEFQCPDNYEPSCFSWPLSNEIYCICSREHYTARKLCVYEDELICKETD